MEATRQVTERGWHRTAGIAFGLGTQVAFAATVWQLFWFLRDGSSGAAIHWLTIDILLALQFSIVHSALLLPRMRTLISRWLPGTLYGCLYCAATCVNLWLVFCFWRGSSGLIWNATGVAGLAVRAGFYSSWIALIYSLSLSGLGYQTGWTQWLAWLRGIPLPRRGLVEHGAYRWLRHPVYLSFLGLIWFTPRMTADHAMLTGVWTVYLLIGSWLKDRRLAFYLGAEYRRYAARVAGYPGMLVGPLGKWPPPLEASPHEHRTIEPLGPRRAA